MASELNGRIVSCVRAWGVAIERTVPTATSLVVHGRRGDKPVVLKVVKEPGDEWLCVMHSETTLGNPPQRSA